jgi:hypothetical protein
MESIMSDRIDILPWERQPGESARAFSAFTAYRDAGPGRSLAKAYDLHRQRTSPGSATRRSAQAPGHWHGWSRQFDWRSRAEAWDAHLDREARDGQVRARRELQASHENTLRVAADRLSEALQSVDFNQMKPTELVNSVCKVIECQRVIHGEPINVERHEHTGAEGAPPVQHQVGVKSTFEPSPEYLAAVVAGLHRYGALYETVPDPEQPVASRGESDAHENPHPAGPSPGAAASGDQGPATTANGSGPPRHISR